MNKKYIVDRKEGEYYILEDPNGKLINIHKSNIDTSLEEGDVLYKKEDKYYYDHKETKSRKNSLKDLMKGMWID